jgi:hypothetical protein
MGKSEQIQCLGHNKTVEFAIVRIINQKLARRMP